MLLFALGVLIAIISGWALLSVFVKGIQFSRFKDQRRNAYGVVEVAHSDELRRVQAAEGFFKGPGANLVVVLSLGGILFGLAMAVGGATISTAAADEHEESAKRYARLKLDGPLDKRTIERLIPRQVGGWRVHYVEHLVGFPSTARTTAVYRAKSDFGPRYGLEIAVFHAVVADSRHDGVRPEENQHLRIPDCPRRKIQVWGRTAYQSDCSWVGVITVIFDRRLAVQIRADDLNQARQVAAMLDAERLAALDEA